MAEGCPELKDEFGKAREEKECWTEIFVPGFACEEWLDVRAFGQVFAFKGEEVSFGVRGAVSIHQAVSLSPIDVIRYVKIVKSVNSRSRNKKAKASDTMGTKHVLDSQCIKLWDVICAAGRKDRIFTGGRRNT